MFSDAVVFTGLCIGRPKTYGKYFIIFNFNNFIGDLQ